MTKDEYRKLLESDYWKGYSYAIVKERGWTCEDCGNKFQYQRNKLNVHHLTYHGDNKPWQYDKDELVLLCRECHAKRHSKSRNTGTDNTPFNEDELTIEKDNLVVKSIFGIAIIIAFITFLYLFSVHEDIFSAHEDVNRNQLNDLQIKGILKD